MAEFGGMVEVSWDLVDADGQRRIELAWVQRVGPPVTSPSRQGFGSRLLERVLTTQIQAEVKADFKPEGLQVRVAFPLP